MFYSMNLSEAYLKDHQLRKDAKKRYIDTKKNIDKIKKLALKKIKYPEYKEAYDYVDSLFPQVKVKNIAIYKVAFRDLAKMGYGGAEGFYNTISKEIVICGARPASKNINKRHSIQAKIEKDEVIVHELCHYCYHEDGRRSVSGELKEEFAYGWSAPYLKQKGYTNEQIVKYNYMPYLVGLSFDEARKNIMVKYGISNHEYQNHTKYQRKEFNKQYNGRIFDRAKEIAMERGLKLIELYVKKSEERDESFFNEEDNIEIDRFDILDL